MSATTARRIGAATVVLGAAVASAGLVLARLGVEPFPTWLYQTAWYGLLLAVGGALAVGEGETPLDPGQVLSLAAWSVPFWYLFEAANLRLANWYYVLAPAGTVPRWVGFATAFATVLPALHLAHRCTLRTGLGRGWRFGGFDLRPGHLVAAAVAGVLFAGLALWRPDVFFPLVWGAVTLLLEPWNCRRAPESSLLADLARGRPGRIVRLLAAGLAVGVVWETLNVHGRARWIYTVPGLEGAKLFEMPLPGYLGFPVLALDAFVAYRALAHLGVAAPAWTEDDPPSGGDGPAGREERTGPGRGRTVVAALAGLALCVAVQAGVDRWTIDSYLAPLPALPGVAAAEAEAVRSAGVDGVESLARADSTSLARDAGLAPDRAGAAVRAARLAVLRGAGAENASALWAAGIRSPCELAEAGQREVSRAIRSRRSSPRAGALPRVRVWLRAAREGCPCGC